MYANALRTLNYEGAAPIQPLILPHSFGTHTTPDGKQVAYVSLDIHKCFEDDNLYWTLLCRFIAKELNISLMDVLTLYFNSIKGKNNFDFGISVNLNITSDFKVITKLMIAFCDEDKVPHVCEPIDCKLYDNELKAILDLLGMQSPVDDVYLMPIVRNEGNAKLYDDVVDYLASDNDMDSINDNEGTDNTDNTLNYYFKFDNDKLIDKGILYDDGEKVQSIDFCDLNLLKLSYISY